MTIQHKSYLVHWVISETYTKNLTSKNFNVKNGESNKILRYFQMNKRWKIQSKTFYGGILLRMVSDYLK